jgi:hypothetical protein
MLDAREVLAAGFGRYWQFTINGANRGAPDPEAVYVRVTDVSELRSVLADHIRWFMPHGTSRLCSDEVTSLAEALCRLARLPDERARGITWQALKFWLQTRESDAVFVRLQVFR